MATLLVTVPNTEALTAVETKAVPLVAGKVKVVAPATEGADRVIVPLVSPEITTEAMF